MHKSPASSSALKGSCLLSAHFCAPKGAPNQRRREKGDTIDWLAGAHDQHWSPAGQLKKTTHFIKHHNHQSKQP